MSEATDVIVGKECRFAIHIPVNRNNDRDTHIVKEQVTYRRPDGTTYQLPVLRPEFDYERAFWVTRPQYRNHQQKKEWEDLNKLSKITCTQSQMRDRIARAIDKGWSKDPIKRLLSSPYIYGADISSSSLLKKDYMLKYPDLISPYTRCIYDTETDMVHGHEEIIVANVVFKNEVFISCTKAYLEGEENVEARLLEACDKYIGPSLKKYDMKITLHIAENVVDLVKTIFAKVHSWRPDWLAIWNIKFDIPKTIAMLEKYGVDPRDVMCDPNIPPHLRVCEFKPGPDKQKTASNKVKPINPAAQWHTFHCSAGYYAIDAMCAYKHLRLGEQEESSYGLDAIMNKHLDHGKLDFKEADHIKGKAAWHVFMQMYHKIPYMVYNIYDCVGMLELDDKIKDLAFTLPSFSRTTDFAFFKSNPRKISDELHYFALREENNCVMGTVGFQEKVEYIEEMQEGESDDDDEDDDEDEENTALLEETAYEEDDEEDQVGGDIVKVREPKTLGLHDWILTLPSHLSALGQRLISEDSSLFTNIRTHVYDSDATAAYPTATTVANVSKTTTKRMIIGMTGVKESVFRKQNMNLLLGVVNSVEYTTTMFNFPEPENLLMQFMMEQI